MALGKSAFSLGYSPFAIFISKSTNKIRFAGRGCWQR
jgi:hypothetical protein